MILVKFSGGLGNQMFQYGMYKHLVMKYPGEQVKADVSIYNIQDCHYGFELDHIFKLADKGVLKIADNKDYYSVLGEMPPKKSLNASLFLLKIWAWTNARLRKRKRLAEKLGRITEGNGKEENLIWNLDHLDCNKNWYIDGYWGDVIYFSDVLDYVIEDFSFPDFDEPENINIFKSIQHEESVAIHVRRGDYVGSDFDVLPMDYYKMAVDIVRKKLPDRRLGFYVFSEEPRWVEANFVWLDAYKFVGNNTGTKSYRDLQLMSLCKHQITANSTFSIWSGYLNKNEDKVVCYPDVYSKDSENSEKKGWVMVKTR